jgi:hypoxanthine phosphoribosyltransferase
MNVRIEGLEFEPMISRETIEGRVNYLAAQLNADYEGQSPVIVGVLNGSFLFMADVVKQLDMPCQIAFIKLASYHGGLYSTRAVTVDLDLKIDVASRHLIVMEDIVDTGQTLHFLVERLQTLNPASIAVCTLLYKAEAMEYNIPELKYIGFDIANKFVVGYGLDYKELGRNLNGIYQLVQ